MASEVQLTSEIHQTPSVESVLHTLNSGRFSLSSEKETQQDIHQLLTAQPFGPLVKREARLSGRDIVDFLIAGSIVVEVKVQGHSKKQIFRQLTRYAKYEWVESLILVTNLAMGLPPTIEGKPAYYVSLGRAWV